MSNPSFVFTRLSSDAEIGFRIGMQVRRLFPEAYMRKEQHDWLMKVVISLMQKLERAKYHVERCSQLARGSAACASVDSETNTTHADLTSGVETEAESFLFQAKATLDLLVQILGPVANIRLRTFGTKGTSVIEALQNNIGASRVSRAAELIRLVNEDQDWLSQMIKSRDLVAHADNLESSGVVSECVAGVVTVRRPIGADGQDISTSMQKLYFNLLTFCEDFVALAINIAMPEGLAVVVISTSNRPDVSKNKYGFAAVMRDPC